MASKFLQANSFLVVDQNSQNIVLINNSETLNRLTYLNSNAIFWVPWTIYYKMHTLVFIKVLTILRKHTNHANSKLGGTVSIPLRLIIILKISC